MNLTIRISRKLYERMKRHPEVKWSVVIRRAIEEYLDKIESEISEEYAEEIVKKFNISTSDIKPLSFNEEMKIYRRMVEEKWKRTLFTIQKP